MDGWLHTIKEILDDPQPDTLDLLDTIKLNLFASEIIVFTPKGEIKSMPANATALDFAFSIHSFLGTHCIGAKVNHKLVPLMHHLKSGDQIEILTSRTQQVKHDWLKYVTTAKAKSKIQACLRKMDRDIEREGENMLHDFLESKDFEVNSDIINKLLVFHHFNSKEDFLLAIGEKKLEFTDADVDYLHGKHSGGGWRKYIPFINSKKETPTDNTDNIAFIQNIDRKKVLTLNDTNIDKCIISDCCHPIPGDDALAFINSEENKLYIHKRNCNKALKLKSNFGNNIVAVAWDMHMHLFETTINISGIDENGMLLKIAEVLYEQEHVNVVSLNIAGNNGIFEAKLTIKVHNTEEVRNICLSLKKIDKILKAVRFD
jgi:GTP pyrophosphokinase